MNALARNFEVAEVVTGAIADVAANDSVALAPAAFLPGSAMIDRAALTSAFALVKSVAEKRNTIPILSNAALLANGAAMVVVTTDLDMEIRVTVPAAIDAHFAITAPAHLLESILKKAAKGDLVSLTTRENSLLVEIERAKFDVQSLPVADFPSLDAGEFQNEFVLPGKTLWGMLDGTMGAISTEETRYYLNGVYAHTVERGNWCGFTLVATDGHRLYRTEIESPIGAMGMPGAIIPRKLVDYAHKLLRGKACPESVSLAFSGNRVRLAFDNVEILSKLVDGTFPDYQRVIPTGNDKPMAFDRDAMAEALQSVSIIASERGRAVKLVIDGGKCTLVVQNPDAGRAESEFAVAWDADFLEIGVNAIYLKEILDDAGAGEVTMEFADCGSPVRITGQREGWDAALMPMRL